MPISVRVDRNILVLEAAGQYTRTELDESFVDALKRPDAQALIGVLLDVRQSISMTERSASELHDASAFYASQKDRIGSRVAVLAGSDAAFGLGRMASVTAEHLGLEVLVCRDAAQAWNFLLP